MRGVLSLILVVLVSEGCAPGFELSVSVLAPLEAQLFVSGQEISPDFVAEMNQFRFSRTFEDYTAWEAGSTEIRLDLVVNNSIVDSILVEPLCRGLCADQGDVGCAKLGTIEMEQHGYTVAGALFDSVPGLTCVGSERTYRVEF